MQENGILVDFLLDFDDKCGMQPSYDVYSNDVHYRVSSEYTLDWTEYVRGRGADGYAIEPQYLSGFGIDTYMPFLEVSVTVMVKMKGMDKPIVLSRSYLPEIKSFDATEFDNAVRKTKPYASLMTGHTALYDYQMTRIYSILDDFDIDAVFPDGYKKLIATGGTGGTGNEGYQRLFDGTTDTKWCTNEKRNDVFYVEFKSNGPIRPAKYYLTTANDTKSYPGRNPKSWKLMAKANEEDAWSTIATVTGDSRLPADNFKRVEYNLDVTGKQWQYFRFEISEIVSGYAVQLAEFDFGTN
jgi:urease gamma subunit